jgi:hypothetical protein
MEGVEDTRVLNRQKAAEHNEVSREIVEAQLNAQVADEAKLRKDPMYYANRIAENNRRLAADYSEKQAELQRANLVTSEGVQEEVRSLRPESVTDPDPVTRLGQQSKVTDISESASRDNLRLKDQIIFGEESYKAQAKSDRTEAARAAGDNRAQEASLTDEPMRVEEPVRNQRREDSTPAASPAVDASAALSEDTSSDNEQKPDTARERRSSKSSKE